MLRLLPLIILIAWKQDTHLGRSRVSLEPSNHKPESIGSHSNGCIKGAKPLPESGAGFQTTRLKRGRFWGHPILLETMLTTFQSSYQKHGITFLVGDLGLSRGGPTRFGHTSHQTGLDVDIFFETIKAKLSEGARENIVFSSFLGKTGNVDLKRWTSAHDDLIISFVKNNLVTRVFIHPMFKSYFCKKRTKLGLSEDLLKKIRPWYGHDDHIHVRLACPARSEKCVDQKPPADTDTCGKDLQWWFTEKAAYPTSNYNKNIKDIETKYLSKMKRLPNECLGLMRAP